MPNRKYSDFIEISPTFESVVDIALDSRNKNLWREYIVGDDMENMMEALCKSLNTEEPDSRRSFWIEGTYGTGKSYAAILIKHLMEERPEVVDAFLAHNSRLAPYRNRFMKCRKNKGDYLVIWKTGCTGIRDGNAMLMEAEKAVRDALAEKFGDRADYGEASLQETVVRMANDSVYNWPLILEQTSLGDDYNSIDKLRESLEAGDLVALKKTAAVIREHNWGLIDSLEVFKKWIAAVVEKNGLSNSGIFFIWDEFTEYVTNSDDRTILQQLSEFCKDKPFFMLFIVHRTTQMIERVTPDRYQQITHRFHQVEFHINTEAAFDLIAGSINIRHDMEEHWKDAQKTVVGNIRPYLPDMSGMDDKISEQINRLCPMHPMTIKLLSRVAENYAASQRTMFRFMKDQSNSQQGFVGYINKQGPEDQACWLTPEWLWDYFFTRASDFSDKDTKAAEYIRHYEYNRHLVENDENAHRIFKIAMLLLALMSSAKGIYSGRRPKDGIAATQDCLETCLAGVLDKQLIGDLLQTMVDSKILVLDEGSDGTVRIQLPFNCAGETEFTFKLSENDKKHSRYMMFSKDGTFAQSLERQAWNENDATHRRMKIAVCCAEPNSIRNRLEEIRKELDKYPYKLGLLIVAAKDEAQTVSIQSELHKKAADSGEPRLTIALIKSPFTDEKRNKWLEAITKQEMASASGQSGSAKQYEIEASKIVSVWVGEARDGGVIAYNGDTEFPHLYGMANLGKIIRDNVRDVVFKFAPENIVATNTAYKNCNDAAPTAGIQRKSGNAQLKSVLYALSAANVLDLSTIGDIVEAGNNGTKQAMCVSELARLVKDEMESGRKVNLCDLWATLQKPPYGYYNTIVCGVLLGFVFSFYKNSKYTWTDSAQSSNVLTEETISKMVSSVCAGKMTTDYISAGSLTWQQFSEYLSKIFDLSEGQLADQTSGYHNVREDVTKIGSPFWVLKYLPKSEWSSEELRKTASQIVDHIQTFIAQETDVEEAMSKTLELFNNNGKIRVALGKAFHDKSKMAATFRSFLFGASSELEAVATRLGVKPQDLSDKLRSAMQGAIYTWTEKQIKEKLPDIAGQYRYLEAVGKVGSKGWTSIEEAKKDLSNLFGFLRIPMKAIQELNPPWFDSLQILYDVAFSDISNMDAEKREADILALERHGKLAMECLQDGKPVLGDILGKREECSGKELSEEELSAVYDGLKELNPDSTLSQFNKELNSQIEKISSARHRVELSETWRSITGKNSIKEWCNEYSVPLMWIIPRELKGAFSTLLAIQENGHAADADVTKAIGSLKSMDAAILTDKNRICKAFIDLIGTEYSTLWNDNRNGIAFSAKAKIGNDMSKWDAHAFTTVQWILKEKQREKAKQEKLEGAKKRVFSMSEAMLKGRVAKFLDNYPEYCDDFTN